MQSETALLQTDKADTHTELSSVAITQLPLPQNRNYQSLINLVPGSTPARMQNSEVDTPGRALNTNVNGLDSNNNGTRTDGAQNLNIFLPHHTMYVSPAETIDTVNVSTSNFDAEQGNAGGAAITVVTKSGTNEFKGSAFVFYNNQNFNARPYFATVKPDASSHIDGVTLGGPIWRDKLFFFGAWEGQFQRTPQQFFYDVPPAALRAGDFSQAFNGDGSLQIIYNPFTGNPDGTGREPFPGNRIPAALFSPIAQKIQALYPDINVPTASTANGNVGGVPIYRNFVRQQDRRFDRNNYDFKVNYNHSPSNQVWGKYSRMGADVTSPQPYPGVRRGAHGRNDSPAVHARRDLDHQLHHGVRRDARDLQDDANGGGERHRPGQLRAGGPRDSRHERRDQLRRRSSVRRHSGIPHALPERADGPYPVWLLVRLLDDRQFQRMGSRGARREDVLGREQHDEAQGRPRAEGGIPSQQAADGPLAAGRLGPRGFMQAATNATALNGASRTRTSITPTRPCCSASWMSPARASSTSS